MISRKMLSTLILGLVFSANIFADGICVKNNTGHPLTFEARLRLRGQEKGQPAEWFKEKIKPGKDFQAKNVIRVEEMKAWCNELSKTWKKDIKISKNKMGKIRIFISDDNIRKDIKFSKLACNGEPKTKKNAKRAACVNCD